MQQNKWNFLTAILFFIPALSSQAGQSYFLTLGFGSAWENAGDSQTLSFGSGIDKTYDANHNTQALPEFEIFFGRQSLLGDHLEGQLGLSIVATGNADLSGDIWDEADSQFNNYDYEYQIQHTHLAMKGKLLHDWSESVSPWISASLGLGFNKAKHYSSTPNNCGAAPIPDFASNTEAALAYSLGMGLQWEFRKNWSLGAGYEFADWGKSELAPGTGQTLSQGLSLSHLYTHALIINLTYVQG